MIDQLFIDAKKMKETEKRREKLTKKTNKFVDSILDSAIDNCEALSCLIAAVKNIIINSDREDRVQFLQRAVKDLVSFDVFPDGHPIVEVEPKKKVAKKKVAKKVVKKTTKKVVKRGRPCKKQD